MIKNLSPIVRNCTHAGTWAAYYLNHPDELPYGAPCPSKQPAEFAEWANHNLPRIVKLEKVV